VRDSIEQARREARASAGQEAGPDPAGLRLDPGGLSVRRPAGFAGELLEDRRENAAGPNDLAFPA